MCSCGTVWETKTCFLGFSQDRKSSSFMTKCSTHSAAEVDQIILLWAEEHFREKKSQVYCKSGQLPPSTMQPCCFSHVLPAHFPLFSYHCCLVHPNSELKLGGRGDAVVLLIYLTFVLHKHWSALERWMRAWALVGGRSLWLWGLCHQEACSLLHLWHHCSIPFHRAGTTETPIKLLISCSPSLTHSRLPL